LGTVGSLAAFVAIVGGSLVTQEVARRFGLDAAMWNAILLLRLPMVLALVSVAVALLFKLGPNTAVPFRWAMVGGALFAVGWLVATLLFGLYVANFSNYSNTYGALGGVVVLMLWFYLTALLLLVAAEVTSELASGRERLVVEGRRRETGSRPRRLRPAPGTAAAEGRAAG
jgi:membrane protein